jgi:hypothetical protein
LKKCFEGIANLDFDEELVINAMNSVEKERVPFRVRSHTRSHRKVVNIIHCCVFSCTHLIFR